MANSVCLNGPAFSLNGELSYTGNGVAFSLDVDGEETVIASQWYLDSALLTGQQAIAFEGIVSCGAHTIGARILTAEGWSGVKTLAFTTCKTLLATAIAGPDTVSQGASVAYTVTETHSDGSTVDITDQYTFTCPDGTFTGGIFTAAKTLTSDHTATITATKTGDTPLTKAITITNDFGGVVVVDLLGDSTLNVIGLVDNSEVDNHHVAAYTSNNTVPEGASPAEALVLASDVVNLPPSALTWRFEFNLAQLLTNYPGSSEFRFYIYGRGATAHTITANYGLKIFATEMTLGGSPGSYIPGINGGAEHNLSGGSTTGPVMSGANGSHAESDLTPIIALAYNVHDKTLLPIIDPGP